MGASLLPGHDPQRRPEVGDDEGGGVVQLLVGVAAYRKAGAAEVELTPVIVLESDRSTVVAVEVSLHRDPLRPPEEVDGPDADLDVDFRAGDLVAPPEA